MDLDFVSVHKNVTKELSHLDLTLGHMNILHADPYKSGKGRQYKKCACEPAIFLMYRLVDFLLLVIWFIKC